MQRNYKQLNVGDIIEHNLNAKQINAYLRGRFKTHLGWHFYYDK